MAHHGLLMSVHTIQTHDTLNKGLRYVKNMF